MTNAEFSSKLVQMKNDIVYNGKITEMVLTRQIEANAELATKSEAEKVKAAQEAEKSRVASLLLNSPLGKAAAALRPDVVKPVSPIVEHSLQQTPLGLKALAARAARDKANAVVTKN